MHLAVTEPGNLICSFAESSSFPRMQCLVLTDGCFKCDDVSDLPTDFADRSVLTLSADVVLCSHLICMFSESANKSLVG